MISTRILAAAAAAALALAGCSDRYWRAQLFRPDAPELRSAGPDAPFLKAHGKDGSVTLLERWAVSQEAGTLTGEGIAFDADRRPTGRGPFTLRLEELALLETNRPETVTRTSAAVMGVVAGASLLGTAYCLTNPKACFGSCPTFYAGPPGAERLVAEGFSAGIARVFEETDVDAVELPGPHGAAVALTMRNEALETHYVRRLRLLAVPRPEGTTAYRAGDGFAAVRGERAPLRCTGAEGDCAGAVAAADGEPYRSLAGERDLAEEELVELAFPPAAGPSGLVIRARNSLLNTFVLYQGLAWLGTRAAETFARMETMAPGDAPPLAEFGRILGRAEVEVRTRSGWRRAGTFGEVGPIAWESELVRLPSDLPEGEVRVRLRLTRGNWKIDRLALAEIVGPPIAPVAIDPSEVRRGGAPDADALARLRGAGERLVSVPGDAWAVTFPIPEPLREAGLFLESRGYYTEWMREAWLREENPDAVVALLRDPRGTLRRLAPEWKRLEPDAERIFWESKVGVAP